MVQSPERLPRLPTPKHHELHAGDVTIHYAEVENEGRPVVLLHGIGMDWRVWQATSRRLSPEFHLHMLDLRGHGESGKPPHGYTLAHYAADVEDLIDHLGIANSILIGSSLGGMVAVSVEAPEDVISRRVLVDPPLTGGHIRDRDMFENILRLKHEPRDDLSEYLYSLNPAGGRAYAAVMSDMWHEASDGVISDMLAAPNDYYAVDASLAAIDSPTLILQADSRFGGVLSDVQADKALDLLSHGSLVTIPGAGHALHAHAPALFAELVREFAEPSLSIAHRRVLPARPAGAT